MSGEEAAEAKAWGHRLSQQVGRNVRRYRLSRKLKVVDLADLTARLGHPMPRMTITNLENGKREGVTVPELLTLSRCLGVPPVALLVPVGRAVEGEPAPPVKIEILPETEVSFVEALMWLIGEKRAPDAVLEGAPYADALSSEAARDVLLARQYDAYEYAALTTRKAVQRLAASPRSTPEEQEAARRDAEIQLHALLRVRREAAAGGRGLPPLPAELAHLEE